MRFSALFSLALVAAAVAPAVMSIPFAGRQSTQPMIDTVSLSSNQTTDDLTDGFLLSLSAEQLQQFSNIVELALNDTSFPTFPMPTTTINSSGAVEDPNQPERLGFIGRIGTVVANNAVGSAVKRALAPPLHAGRPWDAPNEPEKRFNFKGFFQKAAQALKDTFGM